MKKAYISRNYKDLKSAGGKAKTDIENILQKNGYRNIGLSQSHYTNKILDYFLNLIGIIKSVFCLPFHGILFLQYPMKKYYSFICGIAHLKSTKVVTVIHDLGTFRRKKLTIEKEIKRLNHSDVIIAQNPQMKDWLESNGYKGRLTVLEVFDYFSGTQNNSEREIDNQKYIVNYAGALSRKKNSFLYEFSPFINTFRFHLYGTGFSPDESIEDRDCFVYKGFRESSELIKEMQGDFGLVWDGNSLDTCSGNFGIYLKYNTPHKISFYIRCHLPVIIWNEAAMASFIKKEKIGFTISSLKELDERLRQISVSEYQEMKNNVKKVSEQLQSGYYMTKALKSIDQKQA